MVKIDIVASALLGAAFVVFGVLITKGLSPDDIASPYLGGWFFEHGAFADIYGFPAKDMFNGAIPQSWKDAAVQGDINTNTLYPYVYPPIWAALLAPVTKVISFTAFSKFVFVLHFVLIYFSMLLSWRLAGRPGMFVVWALVLSLYMFGTLPGVSAIVQNQPQIFVVFLMLLGLERLAAGHSRSAGIVLAVAATLKITPVLLIMLFVVQKDWRGFWAMVATGALVVLASFALAGVDLHLAYLAYVAEMGNTVFVSGLSWTLSSSLYQLSAAAMSYPVGAFGLPYTGDLPQWISWVSTALLLGGLVYWLMRLRAAPAALRPILYAIVFIWMGFFGPLGWAYYYLPVLFLWPAVIFYAPSAIWRLSTLALFFAIFRLNAVLHARSLSSSFDLGNIYGAAAILALLLFLIYVQWRGFKRLDLV